jgi:hypothetical protein
MEKRRIVSYDVYAYGHNGVWTDSHGAEDWNQRAREGEDAGIVMSRHEVRCPVRLMYYIATKEQQFTRLRTTTTTHPTSTTTTLTLQKKRTISYHQQHVKGRGGTRCTETGIQLYLFLNNYGYYPMLPPLRLSLPTSPASFNNSLSAS